MRDSILAVDLLAFNVKLLAQRSVSTTQAEPIFLQSGGALSQRQQRPESRRKVHSDCGTAIHGRRTTVEDFQLRHTSHGQIECVSAFFMASFTEHLPATIVAVVTGPGRTKSQRFVLTDHEGRRSQCAIVLDNLSPTQADFFQHESPGNNFV